MPHIHTAPGQHDHTVTAYIIRIDTPEPLALLHMHKKLGVLLPVGGHIELHENPWEATVHEINEESGYNVEDLEILQPPDGIEKLSDATLHPYPLALNTHAISNDHFHSDIAFGFIAIGDPSNPVGKNESQDLRWYTHKELLSLSQEDIRGNTCQIYDFMFAVALSNWKRLKIQENSF